jgi:hypothetical protein
VNANNNSYFGQLFADTSVAANIDWITAQTAPEPGTVLLFGTGLGLIALRVRRRTRGNSDQL